MSDTISWNLQLKVREGRLNDARKLVSEMVVATRQEPGALGYEWFLSADGKSVHINECYANSEAVLTHITNFGSKFGERFMACFEPTAATVYGQPSDKARAALDRLHPAYLAWLDGFHR